MAEEPENLVLRQLREMRAESAAFREEVKAGFTATNERLDRLEAESKTQSELLGKVMDATLNIAETQQMHGARLNIIDARLATIERHTGLVKA